MLNIPSINEIEHIIQKRAYKKRQELNLSNSNTLYGFQQKRMIHAGAVISSATTPTDEGTAMSCRGTTYNCITSGTSVPSCHG